MTIPRVLLAALIALAAGAYLEGTKEKSTHAAGTGDRPVTLASR